MLARYPKVDKVFKTSSSSSSSTSTISSSLQPYPPGHHQQLTFRLKDPCWTPVPSDTCSTTTTQVDSRTSPVSSIPSSIAATENANLGFLRIPDSPVMDITPEDDFKRICQCVHLLQLSGYFYEGLSWQQAAIKLRKCQVGTFLVRESENANFLFTLSVQTKKGPTSIRIAYKGGKFRFDSDEELVPQMPVFDTVTDLIEYYVAVSKSVAVQSNAGCFWCDLDGEWKAPVELYYPLYRQVHSLKHLCRLNIAGHLKTGATGFIDHKLDDQYSRTLPVALLDYIKEYTHAQ